MNDDPVTEAFSVADITDAVRVPLVRGRVLHQECRPLHGLVLPECGSVRFEENGLSLTADPEHAILLPAGTRYRDTYQEAGTVWVFNFTGSGVPEHLTSLPAADPVRIHAAARQLADLVWQPGSSRCARLSVFYRLLACFSKQPDMPAVTAFPEILRPSILYLQAHYTDPALTPDILAAQSNISTVYFRRLFCAAAGKSPMRCVNDLRIACAKRLLTVPGKTVAEIAADCGWSDAGNFSAAFRKAVGKPPHLWRKEMTDTEA